MLQDGHHLQENPSRECGSTGAVGGLIPFFPWTFFSMDPAFQGIRKVWERLLGYTLSLSFFNVTPPHSHFFGQLHARGWNPGQNFREFRCPLELWWQQPSPECGQRSHSTGSGVTSVPLPRPKPTLTSHPMVLPKDLSPSPSWGSRRTWGSRGPSRPRAPGWRRPRGCPRLGDPTGFVCREGDRPLSAP